MASRPLPTPPPTPVANHTGVVSRWKAIAATVAAALLGWAAGRYGLGDMIAGAAVVATFAGCAGIAAWGFSIEHGWPRRRHDFDNIDARHQVARALEGDRH